jgi:hypothetical protein
MKTFISFIALAAIISSYTFSISLYDQGNSVAAYSLVMAAIAGLVFWIQQVSLMKPVAIKLPSFKTVLSLVVLVAIVSVYLLSTTLYVHGNLVSAYSLIIGSIVSLIFWIQDVSLQLQNKTA